MASNLIEMFHNTVGDLLVRECSGLLGESAESTTEAVKAIVPSLLACLSQKVGSDEGAASLLKYFSENNIDGSILSNAASALGGNIETEKLMYSGAVLLRYLLNDKIVPVVDMISGPSGLKTSSATSLLKIVAPFLMGLIGKHILEKGLDAPGLKSLLQGQKDFIKASLPKGMDIALGLNANLQPTSTSTAMGLNPSATAAEKSSFSKLLPWIVLLLTALGLYYFVQKGCGKAEEVAEVVPAPVDSTPVTKTETNNPYQIYRLPDGGIISVLPGSFTGQLITFLSGPDKGDRCIAFDKVNFENGSFKIALGSETQLKQLASILTAYPEIKIQIEGHTDEEGDNGKNKNLSKERAKVIKTWLTDHKIDAARIDTKGWGEEKPIASNETKAGREKNRRLEVCLTKK
jgi:OOP family OmpA-OmpF porin